MNNVFGKTVWWTVAIAGLLARFAGGADSKTATDTDDEVYVEAEAQLRASAAARVAAHEKVVSADAALQDFVRHAEGVSTRLADVATNAERLTAQRITEGKRAFEDEKQRIGIEMAQRMQLAKNLAAAERRRSFVSDIGHFLEKWVYDHPRDAVQMMGDGIERFGWQLAAMPQALVTGDFKRLSDMNPLTILTLNIASSVIDLGGTTLAASLAVLPVQGVLGGLIEENPDKIADDACPVYYVGGIDASAESEQVIAKLLSAQLEVPVYVIDQETEGKGRDKLRAAASRLFPGLGLIGVEPATRKILWVIRHHPRATIIAHSFGNLLTRQAIIAAATLGDGPKMHKSLSWVLLAPPLFDSIEDPITPARHYRLMNPGDKPTQLLGTLGLLESEGDTKGNGHSAKEYVKDVQKEWLIR